MKRVFEVEAKFQIDAAQFAENIPAKLSAAGFVCEGTSFQEDHFLPVANPSDNKRVRFQQCAGKNEIFLTIKQKVLVEGVATRKEQETSLTPGEAQAVLQQAWEEAGSPAPSFSKFRNEYKGTYAGKACQVCLDSVDDNHHFMEVELLVESEEEVSRADLLVDKFAIELLGQGAFRELRSHKEMLFERMGLSH